MKKRIILILSVLGLIGLIALQYFGHIWYNALFARQYPIKGLDVSHHQGQIDWASVAQTGRYRFVYIKATEGHDFIDDRFKDNWQGAQQQGLRVGAYHFFSMRSRGAEQAALFQSIVPVEAQALPPVIDVEIALSHEPDKVRQELQAMVQQLQHHYGKPPIVYVTYDTYERYLRGFFHEYRFWIRDVFWLPWRFDGPWVLWQYNNRGHVPGIATYVDINVFQGSDDDFKGL